MKIIVYINFILTLLLVGAFIWLIAFQKQKNIVTSQNIPNTVSTANNIQYIDDCGDTCKKQINDSIAASLSTVSAGTKETIKTVTVTPAPVKSKAQIAYIPIPGNVTTTSSDWYDAPNTDFYLNITGDYGKINTITWEGSLKVAHGNGTAYARLFDVTHGIAVNGSEISLTDNPNLTQVYSGNLNFWAGNNLYRVQFKSLNTFEVTFGGGNIKVSY